MTDFLVSLPATFVSESGIHAEGRIRHSDAMPDGCPSPLSSEHDVDDLARNDDHFFRSPALGILADGRVGQHGRLDLGRRQRGRQAFLEADLAVERHGVFDALLDQTALVVLRETRVENGISVSELLPYLLGDVRSERSDQQRK